MTKHPKLTAEKRTVLGKKVKKLRREGLLPANVYGKDLASTAVQVNQKEFNAVFKEVGETGLVDLQLDGQTRPVLVKNLQIEYPERLPLHADFYQVNLKEKVKTMIPLVIVGEAKAVTEKIGLLLQPSTEVEVEALPEALPENIEVNVEHLTAIDETITVGDLKIPAGVTLLSDPGQTVAKIAELIVEEPEPEPEAETTIESEEGKVEAGSEGVEKAEGDSAEKKIEKKPDGKKDN